jgi:hypothetical protein
MCAFIKFQNGIKSAKKIEIIKEFKNRRVHPIGTNKWRAKELVGKNGERSVRVFQ